MRVTPLTVTALAAVLLLSGCDGDGGGSGDAGTGSGRKTTAAGPCALRALGVEVGPVDAAPAAGDLGNVTVTLTNRGDAACTLQGFPDVTLAAGSTTAAVNPGEATAYRVSVPREGTVTFTIGYTRGAAGAERSLAVETVRFGLPGASETHEFPWSYGDVALRGGGVPEASVSPFLQPAGD
ncbi:MULTISPECIES: DUF4232 domain-containing protein [Streptomyces]|jgi:hypothetical protein|uniref:DUF4232 domain-containing protein n=1 Tax=Streptomyces TaxID=1883 RepID=UPI000A38A957|nr:DUF4232 domain-containing protein [Streptomyces glaucescens]